MMLGGAISFCSGNTASKKYYDKKPYLFSFFKTKLWGNK